MMAMLYDYMQENRFTFLALFFISLLLSKELGLFLGLRRKKVIGDARDEGAMLVVGSVLGLLAFVLALNLSAATSRFEARNIAALNEVNAIGTAALQAGAVGGNQAEKIASQMKEYLELRYHYVRATNSSGTIGVINDQTNELQNRIWGQMETLIRENSSPSASSLMNAVNAVFDASTSMRQAMEFRMPMQIILLLLAMSLLGVAAVGYQFGLLERKGRWPGVVLSILWCVIVTQIIDIGSARIWKFRTDTRVYEWTMDSIGMELPKEEFSVQ